ncbi:hypothetical protein ACFFQW_28690 [Umezawaea endophytica]|uniref:Cytochrome P450 n=1 Tax=Umezawaea endophytica TaxID=1654476 RepID=A0A9X3AJF7_9PSEU|nr:hypothetical protein [Umezawaea endophytica]MCS7483946.1 hypothetical protein [Umezawaea endophytica]
MLTDPEYTVPPVPDAVDGVAWLRASVARFSEGVPHRRRRAVVEAELAAVDPGALRDLAARRRSGPVEVLAEALGLSVAAEDVEVVARSYQPHTAITDEADEALARLVAACGAYDEVTANRIGLLVQACAATAALVAGVHPPVPTTRRVAPDGAVVEVDLTDHPFGLGAHACPGERHALAIAEGLVR